MPPAGARARRQRARRRIAGSSRSTAATGAAAPSSAQLNPPNAIIDAPTALCANMTSCAERRCGRRRRRSASDQNTTTLAATTSSRLQMHRPLAQPRRLVLQLVQARAPGDEAVDRPAGEAEQPQLLARPADRRRAGRRSRRRAARRAPRRCCGRARRRSRAAASASPARRRRARAAPTTRTRRGSPRDARPPIISTRPLAMKSIEIDSGGPVMPRSKSRATVRSLVSVGSSRWPMPGGRTHASVSRS